MMPHHGACFITYCVWGSIKTHKYLQTCNPICSSFCCIK